MASHGRPIETDLRHGGCYVVASMLRRLRTTACLLSVEGKTRFMSVQSYGDSL